MAKNTALIRLKVLYVCLRPFQVTIKSEIKYYFFRCVAQCIGAPLPTEEVEEEQEIAAETESGKDNNSFHFLAYNVSFLFR